MFLLKISDQYVVIRVRLCSPGVDRNKVLLFVTDAAPYMVASAKVMMVLYPKMIHVTCVAH